jgi:CMP-N,N'-diacetyllegionaminic acid synthase
MEFLGFIPARAGSKGIKNKNLIDFDGKPLLSSTLDAASKSKELNGFFLSSDSQAMRDLYRTYDGAWDYQRPAELASDSSLIVDALKHALSYLTPKGINPKYIVLLQPTSPLRTEKHIDEAIQKFKTSPKKSLISVNAMSEHPMECIFKNENNWNYLVNPGNAKQRQDYEENYYFINGAIYIADVDYILNSHRFYDLEDCEVYEMDQQYSVDIDTEQDLVLSRSIKKYLNEKGL